MSTVVRMPSSPASQRGDAERLRSRRQTYLAAGDLGTGEIRRVALYVLVAAGQDPAVRFAAAQALAAQQGWIVVTRTFDTTGPTDPATRPQLARLHSAVHHGEIHVIVAASRIDISAFDDQYERVLDQLRARGGGLALACDETSL